MNHFPQLPASATPPPGSESLLNLADWGWLNWLNFLIVWMLIIGLFVTVRVLVQRLYHRHRLCVAREYGLRGGFTEYATNDFQAKVTELEWLLCQAYEHLEGRGVTVGNDGAIALHFPVGFWKQDFDSRVTVEITSSAFGAERVTRFGSIDGALDGVRRWHRLEMKAG